MFDKKVLKQVESLLSGMNQAQKDKLKNILKDEESIKNALKNIDPDKAKQAVRNVNINGIPSQDLNDLAEQLTKNPDIIQGTKPKK